MRGPAGGAAGHDVGGGAGAGAGGLRVHVAERFDVLVDALGAVLADVPADPFAPDVVAVPTRGVERWVAQRLARRLGAGRADGGDGICANVRFDPPRRLVADALAAVVGRPDGERDPWSRSALAWTVLAVLDEGADEAWLRPVVRHLGTPDDEVRRGRRLPLAQHLAGLLGRYDEERPSMVVAWAAGRDEDGTGRPLAPDVAWQARLWRTVRERLGVPAPSERLDDAVAALVAEPDLVDLPARVSVLGATALPAQTLRVLGALAAHREVHLWLPQPSLVLWERLATQGLRPPLARADLPRVARHRLLTSTAGDALELGVRVLAAGAAHVETLPAPPRPATVLGALQTRLAEDRTGGPVHVADPGDRTVQVHACHGRARQVEVLREVLVGLLADDPTLEPRDVVVLCPDVEAFAPLVEAVLGLVAGGDAEEAGEAAPVEHPGRSLRVRIADRAPARANPVLVVLATLLELAASRVTASAVVDLAGQPPVRRRFDLDDAALDRVRSWAVETGVRWGEDVGRRARYGLGRVGQGTWSAALDRLALGVAMAEEDGRYVEHVLPVDDVGSTDADLVGRLAELVDRLSAVLAALDGARPATAWCDALSTALALLTDVAPADRWQAVEADRVLADLRRTSVAGGDPELRLPDVVAALEPRLRARPTRSGFRTGALTVCSLAPMRAVPHRVVALLGLDDGAFPRGGGPDGDDVLARRPLVGERDRRQEDRQLFLDAVLSATDHLVVVHAGADERTGARRPPAVPVGELLDALDDAVASPDGRDARARVVRHPLQTVDERNFVDGALGRPGPFSFDAVDLAATRRARAPREAARPFLPDPLGPADASAARSGDREPVPGTAADVDLDDLVTVLEHPVRALVRGRLGVVPPRDEPPLEDRLPLALDGLEQWDVGNRVLTAVLSGTALDAAVAAERRRGHVPPGELGGAVMTTVRERVAGVLDAAGDALAPPPEALDVDVALPPHPGPDGAPLVGRRLTGTVDGVRGDVLVRVVLSRLAAKHRLRAWLGLLALTAALPGRTFTATTVGRGPGAGTNRAALLAAPAPEVAARLLADLVVLHDAARCEVLPLPLNASCAYARALTGPSATADDAEAAARDELGTPEDAARGVGGFDLTDAYHVQVWGAGMSADDVLAARPTPAEAARAPGHPTRLGALSVALWADLLAHEQVVPR